MYFLLDSLTATTIAPHDYMYTTTTTTNNHQQPPQPDDDDEHGLDPLSLANARWPGGGSWLQSGQLPRHDCGHHYHADGTRMEGDGHSAV